MEIRKLYSQEELLEVVEVEKAAWGFDGVLECTPPHVMQASNKIGGLVLGAFHDRQLVGFAYTMAAFDQEMRPYHHMHSLGVRPTAQHLHPGFALLRAHLPASLEMGITKLTWTFDPLEPRNANLYIRKVGAVVETPYVANMYGDSLLGGINAGIPADRFIATWHLDTAQAQEHLQGQQLPKPSLAQLMAQYAICSFEEIDQQLPLNHFLLEIPADFQQIKAKNIEKALQIRLAVRAIATQALAQGRKIVDFFSVITAGERRNFYLIS